ncbi:MAG: Eco57I restriction-modification methylase domain-containing protein [Gemmatimonadota bacterium]
MLDLFDSTWSTLWEGRQERESVGAVFTRPEIVELILDLAGYSVGRLRLAEHSVLEPSCGDGAFVTPIVSRLLESERSLHGAVPWDDPVLDLALRAVDISAAAIDRVRASVAAQLDAAGCPPGRSAELVQAWLTRTDFLLHDWERPFDFVVGNPPYVRIEDVPRNVLAEYRALYATVGDRADLYVAFLERGLGLLSPRGVLAFITANRFAKNLYGRKIRSLIAARYRVRFYLNLEHTQPFLTDVSAYPAIVVLDHHRGRPTRAGTLDSLGSEVLAEVRAETLGRGEPRGKTVHEFPSWYPEGGPWTTTCTEEHGRLGALQSLSPLERSAPETRVGIGVATGADRVFILPGRDPVIEADRQIPMVMGADVSSQAVSWSGHFLVNPFAEDGALVPLSDYPGLAAYLTAHADRLRRRHVARSREGAWYRTIDRVWPELQHRPKLLIPDIQKPDSTVVCLDTGEFYPHHNLYWITSATWDLRALQTLLRSSLVRDQVRAYSVQMRGGSLRWQAQTLRKVRLPALGALPDSMVETLIAASGSTDQRFIDEAALEAFSA